MIKHASMKHQAFSTKHLFSMKLRKIERVSTFVVKCFFVVEGFLSGLLKQSFIRLLRTAGSMDL